MATTKTDKRHHVPRGTVARYALGEQVSTLLRHRSGMPHERAAETRELPLATLKSRPHAAGDEPRELLGAFAEQRQTEAMP